MARRALFLLATVLVCVGVAHAYQTAPVYVAIAHYHDGRIEPRFVTTTRQQALTILKNPATHIDGWYVVAKSTGVMP
jgi:hypothetical protein